MQSDGDKKQKELEKGEGAPGSQSLSKEPSEKTASTEQASTAAGPQFQGPSMMVKPATPQPRNTSQALPSKIGSAVTPDITIFMTSPYRTYTSHNIPPVIFCRVPFSKEILIRLNHNQHHLEIDLLRPEGEVDAFPTQDLSPLCLYRELRSLKITGMMQSYQSYIWLVVWLNPQMTDLTLEMAGEAESLDIIAIAETQKYAECKPTMREVAQGKTRTEVPEKFQIVNLSLTNFVMQDAPFEWFSDTKLRKVKLHRCKDAGFQLPIIMERSFNVTLTV